MAQLALFTESVGISKRAFMGWNGIWCGLRRYPSSKLSFHEQMKTKTPW